jgi:hypothetical protein
MRLGVLVLRQAQDEDTGFSSFQTHTIIVAPPSMTMVWPVIQHPASEARNTAAPPSVRTRIA